MRGHLQCRDTLAGNEGCPLKTGTTVMAQDHGLVPDHGLVLETSGYRFKSVIFHKATKSAE